MSMTVVVTRNVSDRVRGFLASSMLELAPGVDWFPNEKEASIVMLWADTSMPGGQAAATLGLPPVQLIEIDGMLATRR